MSLDKSFYMDEELGLDLKQPISKVDLTSIDLCLLSLDSKLDEKGKSKIMEVDPRKKDITTIKDLAAKDSEIMLRDLQETIYSALNVVSDKCKTWSNDIDEHHNANFTKSAPLTCGRRKCGKTFNKQTFLKIHTKNKHTYSGIIAGRVKKAKQKYKKSKEI